MAFNSNEQAQIAAILEQLRTEVRLRREQLSGDTAPSAERALKRALEEIEVSRVVSDLWPMTWHNLPTRLAAGFGRIVRRGLRWYIRPIVQQQNGFNESLANAMRQLVAAYEDLALQMRTVEERLDRLPSTPAPAQSTDLDAPAAISPLSAIGELQAEVERRAKHEPPLSFSDAELQRVPQLLARRDLVTAHWELKHPGRLGTLVVLSQKLIRRMLRFLVNPLVEQQNGFYTAAIRGLLQLVALDERQRAAMARTRAHVARRNRIPGNQHADA